MMDKDSLRTYFIERKADFCDINNIKEKLDNLSIIKNNQLDMKFFYNEFLKIASWELIYSIPVYIELNQNQDKVNFVSNLQAWAFNAWEDGIKDANLNKIVTAYTIIERLYLSPTKDLNWNVKSIKMTEHLKKALKTMRLDVKLDDLPTHLSYEDRKCHEAYKKALENNDYKGIIEFLSNKGFIDNIKQNPEYHFMKIIIRLSAVQPEELSSNLNNYSPTLLRAIFINLNPFQIVSLLKSYQDANPLPLLLGLIHIVNPDGINVLSEQFTEDYLLIENASYIVEKISLLIKADNLFDYITDCNNIALNKLWHEIFVSFVGRNTEYSQNYVDSIDFLRNDELMGKHVFYAMKNTWKNDNDTNAFSVKIYEKYLQKVKTSNHGYYFKFTSYCWFLFHAVYVISNNSFSEYTRLLEKKSIDLQRAIYSWNHDELIKYFADWFYWIISAKLFTNRESIRKETMLNTYALLKDDRLFLCSTVILVVKK